MRAEFVTTRDGRLLSAVREAITGADRAVICVAFAADGGVRLLQKEFESLTKRRRPVQLVATTTFGTTTPGALALAQQLGVDVKTHNPLRGTFHPKVYLGVGPGGSARAFVGSANLTGGLASNVEAGMYLEGTLRDQPLKSAWAWAEQSWGDPVVELWQPKTKVVSAETIDDDLYAQLEREVARDPKFMTLGKSPRPNIVRELTRTHLLVDTEKTLAERTGPQPVPAWMLNIAWSYLKTHGELTNQHLLNELRVHRSSFVCAVLARTAVIETGPGPGIRLIFRQEHQDGGPRH